VTKILVIEYMTINFGRNVLRPFKKDGRCDPLVTLNCRPIGFGHSKVIDGRQRPSSDQYGGSQVSIFLVVKARLRYPFRPVQAVIPQISNGNL
jgi:hypothetical protein